MGKAKGLFFLHKSKNDLDIASTILKNWWYFIH